jgi:hypothetical protein
MAGLVGLAVVAVLSAVMSLSATDTADISDVAQSIVIAVALSTLMIAGLSTRSPIAHLVALGILVYLMIEAGWSIVTAEVAEPFRLASGVLAGSTFVALVADWKRYWKPSGARTSRPVLADVQWTQIALYTVLATVALSLVGWALFSATFGRLTPGGPAELTVVVGGFGAVAIAIGAMVLVLHRPSGAILVLGGLTVAFIAFAGDLQADDDLQTRLFKIGLAGLSLAGIVLLVKAER